MRAKGKAAATGASTAASTASSSSTLPARLELTCSVPGSSETFAFVAEGALRKFTVGRVKNGRSGLCLKDDQVSSKHAEVEWVQCEDEQEKGEGPGAASRRPQAALGGAWVLRDLGSSNGTAINGLRVEPLEPYELKHSDEISFGLGSGSGESSSSRCSVALSLCERRTEEITVGRFLTIEAGKAGDRCKAHSERAAGGLRARFRGHKKRLYGDALAAWRAVQQRDNAAGGGGAEVKGKGGAERLAAVKRLRSGLQDGGKENAVA